MGQAANRHPCTTQAIYHEGREAAMDTDAGDGSDQWAPKSLGLDRTLLGGGGRPEEGSELYDQRRKRPHHGRKNGTERLLCSRHCAKHCTY